ncbi:hypothetical protein [Leifsonia sp. SIMBA_070]|uniref:hypothetical protein n=1 Tax=Leifsonia sp. SIMBA_070 TaxID=3085810 RepID=UPI0039797A4D
MTRAHRLQFAGALRLRIELAAIGAGVAVPARRATVARPQLLVTSRPLVAGAPPVPALPSCAASTEVVPLSASRCSGACTTPRIVPPAIPTRPLTTVGVASPAVPTGPLTTVCVAPTAVPTGTLTTAAAVASSEAARALTAGSIVSSAVAAGALAAVGVAPTSVAARPLTRVSTTLPAGPIAVGPMTIGGTCRPPGVVAGCSRAPLPGAPAAGRGAVTGCPTGTRVPVRATV